MDIMLIIQVFVSFDWGGTLISVHIVLYYQLIIKARPPLNLKQFGVIHEKIAFPFMIRLY